MQILHDIGSLRTYRQHRTGSVGLVPTMGALHEGHAQLVRQAVSENDHTIVSIFVNPTQFGPNEDFDQYPRDLDKDQQLLASLGVDSIFFPTVEDVYPVPSPQITYTIGEMAQTLDAASRPDHMNGVLQVVAILFHLVQPTRAYFGLKDYQQQLLIRQMVREQHFPLDIVPCPIVRESDGLAMSSRNRYLSPQHREQARFLSHSLAQLKAIRGELHSVAEANAQIHAWRKEYPAVQLDYFEVLRGEDLQPLQTWAAEEYPVAFIAAYLGETRLIDNMPIWEYPD